MVEMSARKRKGEESQKTGGGGGGGGKKEERQSEGKPAPRGKPFQGRYNPKLSDRKAFISHKSLAKFVMGGGAIIFAVWSRMNQTTFHSVATVGETLKDKRVQQFACSPAYREEILTFGQECLPLKCGRFVVDGLVTEDEAHKLLNLAKKGLSKGGGSGGASILDLHSGALSHGDAFINLYKTHPNTFTQQDFNIYRTVKDRVKEAVSSHFNIDSAKLYLTHPTFFSELTALPASTLHDEYWHPHVDKETYPSFHYTSLVYLSDYMRDFTGGRFVFMDTHLKANRTIDPKEGRVSAFTSGKDNKHYVEPVTGGSRYALTMGFTCDPSKAIADPGLD